MNPYPLSMPSEPDLAVYFYLLSNKLRKCDMDAPELSNYANSSRLLVGSLRPLFIVMGHLKPCSSVSTLHIESFVCLTAIQYALIASHLLCQVVQCLYEPQAQFLPLLILGNGNVFDMAHKTEAVDEFALNNY